MKMQLRRYIPQPLTAIIMGILALTLLIGPWFEPFVVLNEIGVQTGLLTVFFAAAIIGAGMNPIHFRRNIKIFLTTVPIYVAALLLPPIVAALTVGISTLALQLLTRAKLGKTGNTPSDIATATGRYVIIG